MVTVIVLSFICFCGGLTGGGCLGEAAAQQNQQNVQKQTAIVIEQSQKASEAAQKAADAAKAIEQAQ
jgi:hypothetical protein